MDHNSRFKQKAGEDVLSLPNQDGTTLVEVMVGMLVFLVIMLGGLQYFALPQNIIVRQKLKRLAVSVAQQKMESIIALGYNQITTALNESATVVSLGSINGTRNTTITEFDDLANGQGDCGCPVGQTAVIHGGGMLCSDAASLATHLAHGDLYFMCEADYKSIDVEISWNDGNNQKVSFTTMVSDIAN